MKAEQKVKYVMESIDKDIAYYEDQCEKAGSHMNYGGGYLHGLKMTKISIETFFSEEIRELERLRQEADKRTVSCFVELEQAD